MTALKKQRVTLIAFLTVALLSGQEMITVSGSVSDKIDHPVEAVTVSYLCDGSEVIPAVQTDSGGYFEFSFNPLGIEGNPFPNPFNATITIPYHLHKDLPIDLSIYDIGGKFVATIVAGYQSLGQKRVEFNGDHLSSGIYFIRLSAADALETRKIVFLK